MSSLNNRDRELVALGASLASNCVPCIQFHVREGRKVGISDEEIEEALRVADKVRQVPARLVLETARAILGGEPASEDRGGGSCCQTSECGE